MATVYVLQLRHYVGEPPAAGDLPRVGDTLRVVDAGDGGVICAVTDRALVRELWLPQIKGDVSDAAGAFPTPLPETAERPPAE